MEQRKVRLPLSSKRGAFQFAKLLKRVAYDATDGFGYEGKLMRAGAVVDEEELRPAPDWPERPVLLECGGHDVPGWGHRRTPQTYILWVWEDGQWKEAARTAAMTSEWATELRPVAMRLVHGRRRGEALKRGLDEREAARRIAELLEAELAGLGAAERITVMSAAHDQIAARAAGEGWRVAVA